MSRRLKLFSGLSTVALTSALVLSACGGEGEGEGGEGEGGEGAKSVISGEAEGEGGESEGEGAAASGEGKSAYIAQLVLIRGHLLAGVSLYEATELEMAGTHMKHPQDELYADLLPVFASYNAKDFANELAALADAVDGGEPNDVVAAKLDEVNMAISSAIEASRPTTKDVLLAVVQILQIAGKEFDVGIAKDGTLVNLHEYQDAYGFISAAGQLLAERDGESADENAAIATAREQVAIALAAAPTSIPAEIVETKSAMIFGAAARIEISALGL